MGFAHGRGGAGGPDKPGCNGFSRRIEGEGRLESTAACYAPVKLAAEQADEPAGDGTIRLLDTRLPSPAAHGREGGVGVCPGCAS